MYINDSIPHLSIMPTGIVTPKHIRNYCCVSPILCIMSIITIATYACVPNASKELLSYKLYFYSGLIWLFSWIIMLQYMCIMYCNVGKQNKPYMDTIQRVVYAIFGLCGLCLLTICILYMCIDNIIIFKNSFIIHDYGFEYFMIMCIVVFEYSGIVSVVCYLLYKLYMLFDNIMEQKYLKNKNNVDTSGYDSLI